MTIRLHVTLRYHKAQACTEDLRQPLINVQLQRPIGGREIQGAGLSWPTGSLLYLTESPHGLVIDRVPRVIGFAPGQAIQVLRAQSFRAVLAADRGTEIVAQYPARGRCRQIRTRPINSPARFVSLWVRDRGAELSVLESTD